MKLPSFVKLLKEQDPDGSFDLLTLHDENGINRFEGMSLCLSRWKHLKEHSRSNLSSDFAHLKTLLGGSMGVMMVKDANEQPTLIFLYFCASETKKAWRYMYEQAELAFASGISFHRNDAFKVCNFFFCVTLFLISASPSKGVKI